MSEREIIKITDSQKIVLLDENVKKKSLTEVFFKIFLFACFCFLTAAGLFSFFAYATARVIYERIDGVSGAYVFAGVLLILGMWLIIKRK